jgi:alpha-amylase/alpha-mannosidase (GH57 family)
MLSIIFCWHFHQPDYRDADGRYQLPWTYLHAVKDYADMAAHLEATPGMRCVVNFVPTLTAQLDDYAEQFRTGELRDPLLASLVDPHLDAFTNGTRHALVEQCFKVNRPTMLEPFAPYRRLYALWMTFREGQDQELDYLSNQFLADLVTWYHLAWTGETLRRQHPLILQLMKKGGGFSLADRQALFALYADIVSGLLPRYRTLAERGQIELSSTPHSHPILPLLIDFHSGRAARADLPLPAARAYPGGTERALRHVEAASEDHRRHFGQPPAGYWPAEGGVSEAAVRLFDAEGARWLATGEGVLRNSLHASGLPLEHKSDWISTPYRLPGSSTALFFRDDHLSDLIGFEYKGWFARDAINHFLHAIEGLRQQMPAGERVVSVILDGENAWEYYPYNGYYFLSELFVALGKQAQLTTTTFSGWLAAQPDNARILPRLVAGSWVYGDFSTWLGDPAKNRAWDWLVAAKQAWDAAPAEARLAAEPLLRSCESSDWFWWFGDYNPADAVASFDRVYRQKLRRLYETLGSAAPDYLDQPLCRGGGAMEGGGVMRRGS